ncbi:MAG TPA: dephospho-CoA kinase [Bacteriovoracaceae bacterium]|nr:dephospho-CoA kinase [Bacteriovoracaceae bacterium]
MKNINPKFIKLNDATRLHNLNVPVIGLTGGIATGKSTVSKMLIDAGLPIIDADKLVKYVYTLEATREFIQKQHSDVWINEEINFPKLREKFFKNPAVRQEIEKFIYERLPGALHAAYVALGNPPYIVYDVPLLFEKQLEDKVDLKVLVYAPRKIQRARLMVRDGHLEEMAETILDHQLDIEDKRLKSDFIIDNSGSMEELAVEVQSFLRQVLL